MYNNNMSKFVGIYGGAFDPPHIAHIETARALIAERGYDSLVFLPSHNPPHKTLSATDEDRMNMLSLCLTDKMQVSDVELRREGVGYTADYLPLLFQKYGDNIEYIIGGDSFLNFSAWHKPLDILRSVKLLVVCRDGERDKLFDKMAEYDGVEKKGITIARYMPPSMSSSEIRNRLRLDMDVSEFLPQEVLGYIAENNLYNEYKDIVRRLGSTIGSERFEHSKNVCLFALRYAGRLKLDYNKVFLAAILHDAAKNDKDYSSFYKQNLLPQDSQNTPIAHAFCGSIVARLDFGIEDDEVLDAIYCHSTAKPNMSLLAKLIYSADMLEDTRDFEGVSDLREIFDEDPKRGFWKCLEHTVRYLQRSGREIYPLTMEAYEYYKKTIEE